MDFTPEMLDAIEAVKGKRNPSLWDPRCAQYLENNGKTSTKTVKPSVKTTNNS